MNIKNIYIPENLIFKITVYGNSKIRAENTGNGKKRTHQNFNNLFQTNVERQLILLTD